MPSERVTYSNIQNQIFPKQIELIYYRIVQELINNSLKHAKPTKINIDIELCNIIWNILNF